MGDPFKHYKKVEKLKAKRDVKGFIKMLGSSEASEKHDAIRGLREIGDPRAVEPLIKALADDNPMTRTAAAGALGSLRDPRASDALIRLLRDDPDASVRFAAAEALGLIGGSKAIEPLLEAFRRIDSYEGHGNPQYAAGDALGVIGGPNVIDGLVDCLVEATDPGSYVVGQSLHVLERLKSTGGVEALIGIVSEGKGTEMVRRQSVMMLDEIGMLARESAAFAPQNRICGEKADDFLDNTMLRSKDTVRGKCTGDEAGRMLANFDQGRTEHPAQA